MADSEEIRTTISVNGGPEIPVDLDNPDAPGNAKAKAAIADVIVSATGGSVAADELRLLTERVERLEEEKKDISDDIKDVYAEAKARGYDPKTMRRIVKLRKMEPHALKEAQALLETYAEAVGLQGVLL